MPYGHLVRFARRVKCADRLLDIVRDLLEIGPGSCFDVHHTKIPPLRLSPVQEHQRSHRMLEGLEVEILHDAHNLGIIHMATHKAAHVILGKTLDKGLIGDEAPRIALIVRLLEITSVHYLQTEESHKVVRNRKHFHKNLLPVISGAAPSHLRV